MTYGVIEMLIIVIIIIITYNQQNRVNNHMLNVNCIAGIAANLRTSSIVRYDPRCGEMDIR